MATMTPKAWLGGMMVELYTFLAGAVAGFQTVTMTGSEVVARLRELGADKTAQQVEEQWWACLAYMREALRYERVGMADMARFERERAEDAREEIVRLLQRAEQVAGNALELFQT